MSKYQMLQLRRLADRSRGERLRSFDAETGQAILINPNTDGYEHEPWPLLGVTILGTPPQFTSISDTLVSTGINEGWIRREGDRAVVCPAGPPSAPFAKTLTFVHADRLAFLDHERGEVIYAISRNPGKYWEDGSLVDTYDRSNWNLSATEVLHFYELELMDNSQVGGPVVARGAKPGRKFTGGRK